jgi:hypothetical protein
MERTKTQTHAIRARNPRFYFVHASTKPRFLTKMRRQKSGIPCYARNDMTMRLYLCKIFARWVYKNTNARNDMTMRWFLSALCVCIFVKYLQDGADKNTNARNDDALVLSARCVCIFVKYLQDGFTKTQTHAMT